MGRDEAKKERNDAVRDLVRIVRKRDPRVEARNEYLAEKAEETKRKQEAKRQADIEKKIAEMAEYEKELEEEMEKDEFWEKEIPESKRGMSIWLRRQRKIKE